MGANKEIYQANGKRLAELRGEIADLKHQARGDSSLACQLSALITEKKQLQTVQGKLRKKLGITKNRRRR